MSIHLLIVGRHSPLDPEIEPAAEVTRESGAFHTARCSSPLELLPTVRDHAARFGVIDTLDLFDHGGNGHLFMGNRVLFNDDGTGRLIARWLRPLLTPDARVRLLGCETAVGE